MTITTSFSLASCLSAASVLSPRRTSALIFSVSAADMPAALKAIAMQEKALDDTGGTAALIDDLKSGKKAAGELASEMESKFLVVS